MKTTEAPGRKATPEPLKGAKEVPWGKRCRIHTPWKFNSSPLKMDGWNTRPFHFGARPIFRGELLVSGSVDVFFFKGGKPKMVSCCIIV